MINVSPLFSNPCQPTNLPVEGLVLWIGNNTYSRSLNTKAFNIELGAFIEWDMKYGANQNQINCESPDLLTEGIHLQWSMNNGTTWTQFPSVDQAPAGNYGTSSYVNGSVGYWTPVLCNAATGPYCKFNFY